MLSPVRFESGELILLDQRKLPGRVEWVSCSRWQEVREAIRSLVVRGAPAIGVAAAYGMALAARAGALEQALFGLRSARPTAINLSWAVDRAAARARTCASDAPQADVGAVGIPATRARAESLYEALVREADEIAREDLEMCHAIGRAGLALIPQGATVMTHCNAGALATVGYGTALGIIRAAHDAGRGIRVIACETRPVLQGARLTTWELMADGIPVTLITDNMAAHVMVKYDVAAVIVGADRIAADGDVANKIGTYGLSILAKHHGVPFYVAAPVSTVDVDTPSGDAIRIEERDASEVRKIGDTWVAPERVPVYNPAFDVTPHQNISAMVLDAGIIFPPYAGPLRALASTRRYPATTKGTQG